MKLFRPEVCNFIKKETLTQVFSCEICQISKNIIFTEHLLATASEPLRSVSEKETVALVSQMYCLTGNFSRFMVISWKFQDKFFRTSDSGWFMFSLQKMDKIKLICVVKDIFFYKNSLRFKLYRSRRPGVFCKKMLLEISQNSQGNTCTRFSLLIKTLAQVFSCEFCEISQNTFFYRTPLVAASDSSPLATRLASFFFS